MNVFGVGNLELLWILLLALVLLGPGRLVDAARAAGKFWREAQHTIRSVADAASINLDAPPPKIVPREPLPPPGDAVARGAADAAVDDEPDPDAAGDDEPDPDAADGAPQGKADDAKERGEAERREAP